MLTPTHAGYRVRRTNPKSSATAKHRSFSTQSPWLQRATALTSPTSAVGAQTPWLAQPYGSVQVCQSCAVISGASEATASHCGAVKNFKPPPAVFTWTCRESHDQSTCVMASSPASARRAAAAGLPSNVSPAKSLTTSVWSTSLYPQCTSRTRNLPSPQASPRNLPQGEYLSASTGEPSGACCAAATVPPLSASTTITLPLAVPTATWSHPAPAAGCQATLRPFAGRRACRSMRFSFSDQKRTLRSSPTVAKNGSLGCVAAAHTSPSSAPDLWSTNPQCPCKARRAERVASSSFCKKSPTTSSENS